MRGGHTGVAPGRCYVGIDIEGLFGWECEHHYSSGRGPSEDAIVWLGDGNKTKPKGHLSKLLDGHGAYRALIGG